MEEQDTVRDKLSWPRDGSIPFWEFLGKRSSSATQKCLLRFCRKTVSVDVTDVEPGVHLVTGTPCSDVITVQRCHHRSVMSSPCSNVIAIQWCHHPHFMVQTSQEVTDKWSNVHQHADDLLTWCSLISLSTKHSNWDFNEQWKASQVALTPSNCTTRIDLVGTSLQTLCWFKGAVKERRRRSSDVVHKLKSIKSSILNTPAGPEVRREQVHLIFFFFFKHSGPKWKT